MALFATLLSMLVVLLSTRFCKHAESLNCLAKGLHEHPFIVHIESVGDACLDAGCRNRSQVHTLSQCVGAASSSGLRFSVLDHVFDAILGQTVLVIRDFLHLRHARRIVGHETTFMSSWCTLSKRPLDPTPVSWYGREA